MSAIDQVETQLREAKVALDAADTLIGQGQVVDLAGLESHVETVCTAIAALPPESCAGLKPTLLVLIDGLNNLAQKLSHQHRAVGGQLQDMSSRRKATAAYGAEPAKPGRPRSE